MKNLFKVTFVAFLAAVMVSCGSASKEDFVGQWTPDLSSVDIHLSEKIPSDYTQGFNLDEVKSEIKDNQKDADKVIIDFKEDGTLTVGPEGETKDFKWTIDGDNLVISGTVPEGDLKGKDFELALEIVDSGSDMFTVKLTAASLLEQAEAQYKNEMDEAMAQFKSVIALLDEEVFTDTWASISFKKKSAES